MFDVLSLMCKLTVVSCLKYFWS